MKIPFILLSLFVCIQVVKSQTSKDTITIYCVGNSMPQGSGLTIQNSYSSQLQQLVNGKVKVYNFGVSGATALRNGNKPYFKETKCVQSLTQSAEIIVLKLGTNDSKPLNWNVHAKDFTNSYETLIRNYRKAFSASKILLLGPLPAWAGAFFINGDVI